MKHWTLRMAALAALGGCASLQQQEPYAGRAIADVVRELGPPDRVADFQSGGRYFSWLLMDDKVRFDDEADNPLNWTEPMTRANAPANLDRARLISLPDYIVSPSYRHWPCSLTLVAEWDTRAAAWIARRAIRKDAAPGGRCGLRVVAE